MLRAVPILCVVAALLAATSNAASSAAPPSPPRVTLIGDSIAASVEQTQEARRILRQGIDFDPQVAVCRRLAGDSCPYEGSRPPTLVDVVSAPGAHIGETAIVAVGYNEFEQAFADDVQQSFKALRTAGVTRVLWVLLREQRHPYVTMNDVIRTAAATHPELTVIDWNAASRGHADWFQDDGLHLTYAGAVAMATLFHNTLVALGVIQQSVPKALSMPPISLGVAVVGRPFAARLHVRGGSAPYRWTIVSGTLPKGLRVTGDGRIVGTPRLGGRSTFVAQVRDGSGTAVRRTAQLASRTR